MNKRITFTLSYVAPDDPEAVEFAKLSLYEDITTALRDRNTRSIWNNITVSDTDDDADEFIVEYLEDNEEN